MEGTPAVGRTTGARQPKWLQVHRGVANGVDSQRLALLLAVLEKRLPARAQQHDVYVNVVQGGLHIEEPAIDLGVNRCRGVKSARGGARP